MKKHQAKPDGEDRQSGEAVCVCGRPISWRYTYTRTADWQVHRKAGWRHDREVKK